MNRRIEKKHRKQSEERAKEFLKLYNSFNAAKRYAIRAMLEGMVKNTLDFNYKDTKAGQAFLKAKEQEYESLHNDMEVTAWALIKSKASKY